MREAMTYESFLLAREEPMPLLHEAIRDELRRGGTFTSVALVMAGLVLLVVVVYLLQGWYDRTQGEREETARPLKTYAELLARLALTSRQQQLLLSVAREQRVRNPTALLISSELFDQYVAVWQKTHPADHRAAELAVLRRELFRNDASLHQAAVSHRPTE